MRISGVIKAYKIPDEFKGNGIAVDIGANVGAFPVVNHNKFKKIYCFEPSEYSFNECIKNTKKYDNVDVFKYAISSLSGEFVKLMAYKSSNYSGNASLLNENRWDNENYEIVETKSIEDIYKIIGTNKIDYLKIDCEGSEYDLLMNKDLSNIKYMAIEVHIQLGKKAGELINYLKKQFNVLSELNDGVVMHKELTLKNKRI